MEAWWGQCGECMKEGEKVQDTQRRQDVQIPGLLWQHVG